MAIDYSKLWKQLIDKRINKSQLKELAQISTNAVAKMGKNEYVSLETLEKICIALKCNIEEIISFIITPDISNEKTRAQSGTFVLNKEEPIHRWYSYIEGYSSCLVASELDRIADSERILTVYDPFGGTGTTCLVSCMRGIRSYYSETNPFMQKVINNKINATMNVVKNSKIDELKNSINMLGKAPKAEVDTWNGFEKYFESDQLNDILTIKNFTQTISEPDIRDIFMLALSSIVVKASKMIRRGDLRYATEKEYIKHNVFNLFFDKINLIVSDIEHHGHLLTESAEKISDDARDNNEKDLFDCVITSPPYLNGTNYIRNTKLELKLNDYIVTENDLPSFHSKGIVSGINNVSKRMGEKPVLKFIEPYMDSLYNSSYDDRIPKMVSAYFYDMGIVVEKLAHSIKNNGYFIMDIGDSQFGGVHIPTHEILTSMCKENGFTLNNEEIIRKRRSKNGMMLSQRILRFKLEK